MDSKRILLSSLKVHAALVIQRVPKKRSVEDGESLSSLYICLSNAVWFQCRPIDLPPPLFWSSLTAPVSPANCSFYNMHTPGSMIRDQQRNLEDLLYHIQPQKVTPAERTNTLNIRASTLLYPSAWPCRGAQLAPENQPGACNLPAHLSSPLHIHVLSSQPGLLSAVFHPTNEELPPSGDHTLSFLQLRRRSSAPWLVPLNAHPPWPWLPSPVRMHALEPLALS
jgi:hypothetical protein